MNAEGEGIRLIRIYDRVIPRSHRRRVQSPSSGLDSGGFPPIHSVAALDQGTPVRMPLPGPAPPRLRTRGTLPVHDHSCVSSRPWSDGVGGAGPGSGMRTGVLIDVPHRVIGGNPPESKPAGGATELAAYAIWNYSIVNANESNSLTSAFIPATGVLTDDYGRGRRRCSGFTGP